MEAPSTEIPEEEALAKIISFKGRELPGEYHAVVISRWLYSLRQGNRFFKMIEKDAYYSHYQSYIKAIIARPNVRINLLALEEDLDIIFGFSVFEKETLHYVHVHDPFRGKQYSYDLIPKAIKSRTHTTKGWETFLGNKSGRFNNVTFNPFGY